ncbi:PEP-CTERM sorting domain-containing protein [Candidatus Accumulibacter phosphatis]|uniref:PEP-CTERM sorting domain-containing protein n=1 Tax=Candidatus Accumulibacter phosphatis TaxID=327160 RepID=A0ABX1U2D7_9PROT|nr:PEP-CTERM sorting domain-containing protein [Candidatus Accumulibacter phosphatis]
MICAASRLTTGALYVVDQFGGSGRILRVALNGAELPEPATLLLTLLGMVGLPVARRRKTLV